MPPLEQPLRHHPRAPRRNVIPLHQGPRAIASTVAMVGAHRAVVELYPRARAGRPPPRLLAKVHGAQEQAAADAPHTNRYTHEEAREGGRATGREDTRERKAESAAKVERSIERVLLERLRSGAYGDQPLNVAPDVWDKVLSGLEREGNATLDDDLDEGIEDEDDNAEVEYEKETTGGVEYVADVDSELDDLSDFDDWLGGDDDEDERDSQESSDSESESGDTDIRKLALNSLKRKREEKPPARRQKKISASSDKGPRVEIEYEMEREMPAREVLRV
jgi:hypothetical protein